MNTFRPIDMVNATFNASCVNLEDFTDDNYTATTLYADRNDKPLIVCTGKAVNPIRYRVIYGSHVCFFINYKDVIDFFQKHRCKLIK